MRLSVLRTKTFRRDACVAPICGDGVLNAAAGETCDDGDGDLSDPCPDGPVGTCVAATCGDGLVCSDASCAVVNGTDPEDCDESGVETDSCDTDCTLAECGDSVTNMSAGETCDDGNTAGDDGCSATCGNEQIQDKEQQRCIVGMNKAGLKVMKQQAREHHGCIRAGLKGEFTDAQVCLTLDERSRVQKARAKVQSFEAKRCTTSVPGFAFTDAVTVGQAAVDGALAVVADIYGADLDEAIITKKSDPVGHACQERITNAVNKYIETRMKEFLKCKRKQLKLESIVDSAADLAQVCFLELLNDPKEKGVKALAQIARTRELSCPGLNLDTTFPGNCVGTTGADFDTCVAGHIDCRVCATLNTMDLLPGDCDQLAVNLAGSVCPL